MEPKQNRIFSIPILNYFDLVLNFRLNLPDPRLELLLGGSGPVGLACEAEPHGKEIRDEY